MPLGLNKLVNLVNFVNGRLNWVGEIELKINDKYDQPAHTRVTQPVLNLAKDTVKGIVGILKHLNVRFKTSDAVLCCVDVTFDVLGVVWEFGSGGI